MESLNTLLGGIGIVGVGIFLTILFILGILMPIFVYTAQRWAHKSYKELVLVNDNLNQLIVNMNRISKSLKASDEKAQQ
jgi:hypothetical protein